MSPWRACRRSRRLRRSRASRRLRSSSASERSTCCSGSGCCRCTSSTSTRSISSPGPTWSGTTTRRSWRRSVSRCRRSEPWCCSPSRPSRPSSPSGLALPISSAIFGAGTLTFINATVFAMADMVPVAAASLIVVLVGLNPMFAFYAMTRRERRRRLPAVRRVRDVLRARLGAQRIGAVPDRCRAGLRGGGPRALRVHSLGPAAGVPRLRRAHLEGP